MSFDIDFRNVFTVVPLRRPQAHEPTVRAWVGIENCSGQEMVRRRSVILVVGFNNIELAWSGPLICGGVASFATLSRGPLDEPVVYSEFPGWQKVTPRNSAMRLHWRIRHRDGDFFAGPFEAT